MDLSDLAKIFAEMAIVATEHSYHKKGLEEAAIIVETEAKALIGQEIPEWEALADSTIEEKEKLGFTGQVSATDPLLRTGELRDSIRHVVEDNVAYVGSDLDKALEQECGTENIPPRPFLQTALVHKHDEIGRLIGHSFYKKLLKQ